MAHVASAVTVFVLLQWDMEGSGEKWDLFSSSQEVIVICCPQSVAESTPTCDDEQMAINEIKSFSQKHTICYQV